MLLTRNLAEMTGRSPRNWYKSLDLYGTKCLRD